MCVWGGGGTMIFLYVKGVKKIIELQITEKKMKVKKSHFL